MTSSLGSLFAGVPHRNQGTLRFTTLLKDVIIMNQHPDEEIHRVKTGKECTTLPHLQRVTLPPATWTCELSWAPSKEASPPLL